MAPQESTGLLIEKRLFRYIGIIVLSALIPAVFDFCDYPAFSQEFWLYDFPKSIIFTFTFWEGNFFIVMKFRKLIPGYHLTYKRLLLQAAAVILFTFMAKVILELILERSITLSNLLYGLQVSLGITFFILTIYEGAYFFSQWKTSLLEAEKLKRAQLSTQFEALKNQISPHFLFNSLNSLTAIIPENSELAVEFTQKLSHVYRYVLQNKDKDVISLEEELEFVRSYSFLNQIRFGENFSMEINVKGKYLQTSIAPLSLQLLVENAVKHNVISSEKPLTIDISVENNRLVVSNNLQLRNNTQASTKMGLQNIINRYQFLAHEKVEVLKTSSQFIVSLPILSLGNESIDH